MKFGGISKVTLTHTEDILNELIIASKDMSLSPSKRAVINLSVPVYAVVATCNYGQYADPACSSHICDGSSGCDRCD